MTDEQKVGFARDVLNLEGYKAASLREANLTEFCMQNNIGQLGQWASEALLEEYKRLRKVHQQMKVDYAGVVGLMERMSAELEEGADFEYELLDAAQKWCLQAGPGWSATITGGGRLQITFEEQGNER